MTQQITFDASVDASDLRTVILEEGAQYEDGIAAAAALPDTLPQGCDGVVVSGMGGSALPADILAAAFDAAGEDVAIRVNRSYALPPRSERALHIVCSHSGNTEETLSCLEEAIARKLAVVGVSAGGRLAEVCRAHDVPHVTLPIPFDNFQPRMATGHFVAILAEVLRRAGLARDLRDELRALGATLARTVGALEDEGRTLAAALFGGTPVIYTSDRLWPLARIWKIKINENAKTPAFWNVFPELNHNEFIGFTLPQADFRVVLLEDPHAHSRVQKRFGVTRDFLARIDRVQVHTRTVPDDASALAQMMRSLALADWTSYYLALAAGEDPTPVAMVEDFKKAL